MVTAPAGAGLRRLAPAGLAVALVLGLAVAGCTPGTSHRTVTDMPAYAAVLRGENDLAHGSAEIPPSASLDRAAHALAVSRIVGQDLGQLADDEWRELIVRSGEDTLWAGYYLCLAGVAGPQTSVERFRSLTGADFPRDAVAAALADTSGTANSVLEMLVADRVNTCLDLGVARPRQVSINEADALTIKARLQLWGSATGVSTSVGLAAGELDNAKRILTADGCSDWNQTLAYAVRQFEPDSADPGVKACAQSRVMPDADPAAVHTSLELGMPIQLAAEVVRAHRFDRYLDTAWRPASSGQEPVGLGTIQNSVALVGLLRVTGNPVPGWLKAGADGQVASLDDALSELDPQLALLCVLVEADCRSVAKQWLRSQSDPVTRVLEGRVEDAVAAATIQALIEAEERPDVLRCPIGQVDALYERAPQTLAQLATIDKLCWESLVVSAEQVSSRISSAIRSGAFEDAGALMLIASLKWAPEQIEPLKQSARAEIAGLSAEIELEHGGGYLAETKPLPFVLLEESIENW